MLLRNLTILNPTSPFHEQTVDLRVTNGRVAEVGKNLEKGSSRNERDFPDGTYVCRAFTDLGAYLGDPGHEEREDIASLRAAARRGGYRRVITLPNTEPVRQSVADVAYLLRQNDDQHTVELLPLAALSKDTAGKDMVDMLELSAAGAVAFTDGPHKPVSASLLKRTLEYARTDGSYVMISPFEPNLIPDGQIHEGEVSTRLGLRGIPVMSETIPLKQACELLDYTDGKLIVHLLSSADGVAEVRRAKAAGLSIFATVSAHHLSFTVEKLAGFDPNYKMLPPLREESDRQALIEGLKDGTIDAIVSNHQGRHGEEKDLEFSYAAFGVRGLETSFLQTVAALDGQLSLLQIVEKFTAAERLLPRRSFELKGSSAKEFVVYESAGETSYAARDFGGKTVNSPFLGATLRGRVVSLFAAGVAGF